MVGEVNFADGIKSDAAQRLFNLLNCLLLAEKRPITMPMLESTYLEVMLRNIQNIFSGLNIF